MKIFRPCKEELTEWGALRPKERHFPSPALQALSICINKCFLAENHRSFINWFNINREFKGLNYCAKGNIDACQSLFGRLDEDTKFIISSQKSSQTSSTQPPLLNIHFYLLLGLSKTSALEMRPDLKRQNLRQFFKGLWVQRLPQNAREWKEMRKKEIVGEVKEERINRSSLSVLKPTTNLPCTFSRDGLNMYFSSAENCPLYPWCTPTMAGTSLYTGETHTFHLAFISLPD